MSVESTPLTGSAVRLEPLTLEHVDGLVAIGLEPEIWRWNTFPVTTREEMMDYVRTAIAWREAGTAIPFATVELASGAIVGSTRLANLDRTNFRAEIGWTWIGPRWQRTAINTEAKLLMLRLAFGPMGCRRVEFKTDSLNERSRAAIERIGGVFEGILRNHMVTSSGRMRHSAYYSILDDEWPSVETRLVERLAGGAAAR